MEEERELRFVSKKYVSDEEADRVAALCHNEIRRILKERNKTMVDALHMLMQTVSSVVGVLESAQLGEVFFRQMHQSFGLPEDESPYNAAVGLSLEYNKAIKDILKNECRTVNREAPKAASRDESHEEH